MTSLVLHEEGNLDLYDKLVLAYIKTGDDKAAHECLEKWYQDDMIPTEFYHWMLEKIRLLSSQPDIVDINRTMVDVKAMFDRFASQQSKEKYSEFYSIFLVLLSGYHAAINL